MVLCRRNRAGSLLTQETARANGVHIHPSGHFVSKPDSSSCCCCCCCCCYCCCCCCCCCSFSRPPCYCGYVLTVSPGAFLKHVGPRRCWLWRWGSTAPTRHLQVRLAAWPSWTSGTRQTRTSWRGQRRRSSAAESTRPAGRLRGARWCHFRRRTRLPLSTALSSASHDHENLCLFLFVFGLCCKPFTSLQDALAPE